MNMIGDVNFWREAITVGSFGLFGCITFWACSRKRNPEFTEVTAQLLQDDDTSGFVERLK